MYHIDFLLAFVYELGGHSSVVGIELSVNQYQDQGFLFELEEHVRKRAGEPAIKPIPMSPLPEDAGQPNIHIRLRRTSRWWENLADFLRFRR